VRDSAAGGPCGGRPRSQSFWPWPLGLIVWTRSTTVLYKQGGPILALLSRQDGGRAPRGQRSGKADDRQRQPSSKPGLALAGGAR